VGRMIRLAFLAPEVLEALVVKRRPPAISINELVDVAKLAWGEQRGRVFEPHATPQPSGRRAITRVPPCNE